MPASADSSLTVVGVSEEELLSTTAGSKTVSPKLGVWLFANSSSTDAISNAHIGLDAWVVDDNTVALTSNNGARPKAGKIVGLEGSLVAVELGDGENASDRCFIAGADLSAKQFHFVNLNSSNQVVSVSSAGARTIGVLQNAPANGAVAVVRLLWSNKNSKVIAGGSIAIGDSISSKNDGRAATSATGHYINGVNRTTASSNGDTINVLLGPLGISALGGLGINHGYCIR